MIIKSHIRAGYRAASDYLKEQGKNEKIRLVEISDPDASNLDEAFHNMWEVASGSKVKKPLHHISINPFKDERLTDKQVKQIVERCEQKYGYKPGAHQRVIVEHIKEGRQHFHVMWNRVSLSTGKAVWPGHHWKKSKQVCREMEVELGLKRPISNRVKRIWAQVANSKKSSKYFGRYQTLKLTVPSTAKLEPIKAPRLQGGTPRTAIKPIRKTSGPKRGHTLGHLKPRPHRPNENIPDSEKMPFHRPEWESSELLAWAFENGRADILAQYGIYVDFDI